MHRLKRVARAKQYINLDFRLVLFTYDCRATLDGFCRGWLHTATKSPRRLRRQQGGGGVIFWAGIVYNKVAEPFMVPEGVKRIPIPTNFSYGKF